MPKFDFLATHRVFIDHLSPIWKALPPAARGEFFALPTVVRRGKEFGVDCTAVETRKITELLRGRPGYVVTAYGGDIKYPAKAKRPVIAMEHGAGQNYLDGGEGWDGKVKGTPNVYRWFVPNDYWASIREKAYPDIPSVVVGTPKLDEYVGTMPDKDDVVVAISFRWDCNISPEARGAFDFYKNFLPILKARLAEQSITLLGHSHPNLWQDASKHYRECGIEATPEFQEVLERAHLYCIDNSSTMFEFASTGRPVLVMNAPWYRRDVNHGFRFWDYADIGVNVERGEELVDGIEKALQDPDDVRLRRKQIVEEVYPYLGRATNKAVMELMSLPETPNNSTKIKPVITTSKAPDKFDFVATHPAFVDHLAPVWKALPDRVKGWFIVPPAIQGACHRNGIESIQVQKSVIAEALKSRHTYVVISYFGDAKFAQTAGRPIIQMEHGTGQSYQTNVPGWSGELPSTKGVQKFLVPNDYWAQIRAQHHPEIPSVVVGTPKMDEWPIGQPAEDPSLVAISFRWNCKVVPEAKGAFHYYQSVLEDLSKKFRLLGHGHPSIFHSLKPFYDRIGIESTPNFHEVVRRAGIYCVDNSSTLFEFAALNRPVVVMNAPWYRRNVQHGLRFWDKAVVGVQCNVKQHLERVIRKAQQDKPHVVAHRQQVTSELFPHLGNATARTVEALLSCLNENVQMFEAEEYPECSWLGDPTQAGKRQCNSPNLLSGGVSASTCLYCQFRNQPAQGKAAKRRQQEMATVPEKERSSKGDAFMKARYPCRHRGEPTGKTVQVVSCTTCNIATYNCALLGECVLMRQATGLPICSMCDKREPGELQEDPLKKFRPSVLG